MAEVHPEHMLTDPKEEEEEWYIYFHPTPTPQPPGDTHGTHFCYRLSQLLDHSAGGKISLSQLKISMTSLRIESTNLRFVAQCLNQLSHHVPRPGEKKKTHKLF